MYSHESSRRQFLKASLIGSAAALTPVRLAVAQAQSGSPATAPAAAASSRVSLTAGTDRADIAFRSLEPFKREIAAAIGNKRVVVKPNCVMINNALCASSADNLEGILEFLASIRKTANVVIAESPASGSAMDAFANYGYTRVATKYKVKLVNLDTEGYEVLHVIDQRDMQPHPIRVSKMLMDPANNYVISAAKFKTHDSVGVTLSLKNIVVGSGIKDSGAAFGRGGPGFGRSDKRLIHGGGPYGIHYNIFLLSEKLHPDLAVIDGYEGMQGAGPINGTPVDQKVCVASTDWLAADRVGTELMGVDFNKIGYLMYCSRQGNRGQADLSKIDVIGEQIKDHVKTYQLSPNWQTITSWTKPFGTA